MRLIDADALKARLRGCVIILPNGEKCMADRVIDTQGTIDAEPVKRGHWILTQDEQYEYCRCSECGYDTGENWMIGSEIKYCENCGARMGE